jgi:AcrR family transcriptional regulator
MATRSEEASVGTPERLIDAALALYREGGWQGASLAAIAGRVGMTTGAIYAHFKGKNELFVAVCEAQFREMARELEARMAEASDPLARLEVLRAWFAARGERAGVRLIYDLWHQATEYPRLRKQLADVYDAMTADVEAAVARELGPFLAMAGVSAKTVAILGTALMEGMLLRQFLSQSNESLDAVFDLVARFIVPFASRRPDGSD